MPIDLHEKVTELRRLILTMGAEVEQRVNNALDAFVKRDVKLAEIIRDADDEIDSMEINIEEECLTLLALSHPVAGDLRFVLSVMRINGYFERIGDMAQSIAKRAVDLAELPPLQMPQALLTMIAETRCMFGLALKALADEDVELAQRVRRSDQRVDDLQKEIFAWVHPEIASHVEAVDAVIDILSVARKLERIADLSTNIAEDVIFLAEGSLVRHMQA